MHNVWQILSTMSANIRLDINLVKFVNLPHFSHSKLLPFMVYNFTVSHGNILRYIVHAILNMRDIITASPNSMYWQYIKISPNPNIMYIIYEIAKNHH